MWTFAVSAVPGCCQRGGGDNYAGSGSGSVEVVQPSVEAPYSWGRALVAEMDKLWSDHWIRQALVISLAVIKGNEAL